MNRPAMPLQHRADHPDHAGHPGPTDRSGAGHADRADSTHSDRAGSAQPLILFYDGQCGICQASVQYIIQHDHRHDDAIRVAPLQGSTAATRLGHLQGRLPDSVVVIGHSGRLLFKSTAALAVLNDLGGLRRLAAALLAVVPHPLRDAVYDTVARHRKRLLRAGKTACRIIPPEKRSRFLP